jgi:hypothetical protein
MYAPKREERNMITLETMLKLTYGDNSQEQMSVRDALNYILKSLSLDCKTVCGIIEELSEGIEIHELDIKVLEFGNTTTSAIVKRVVQALEDALREDLKNASLLDANATCP